MVPKGAVLLPLLFSVYVCDVPIDKLNKGYERGGMFVDDICIYSSGDPANQITDLNLRLDQIYKWSNEWGVDFNAKKV